MSRRAPPPLPSASWRAASRARMSSTSCAAVPAGTPAVMVTRRPTSCLQSRRPVRNRAYGRPLAPVALPGPGRTSETPWCDPAAGCASLVVAPEACQRMICGDARFRVAPDPRE
ncbi:hypothetical protein GCM10010485_66640 [Streptosporangium carneum]